MPTASSKHTTATTTVPPINMPDLLHEPIKNMVCVLEKKLRNLEKRKLKLIEMKKKADDGSELNEDQKKAVENLILVDNSLATVKEVHKTLGGVEQEYLKLARKEQKRVKQEQKELFETKCQDTVYRTIQIQAILGELNEDVRPDFLNASNGACQLTDDELANLDSFYELINVASETKKTNFSSRVSEVSLHLFNVIEAKEKVAFEDVTYKDLSEVLTRIEDSGYFNKSDEIPEEEVEVEVDGNDEEGEESASLEGDDVHVETESNDIYAEDTSVEFSQTEVEPMSEPFVEQPPIEDEIHPQREVFNESPTPAEETNGVDLPPEVQQSEHTPDNEKLNFMGESEISPAAMLEAQQPLLNPVSPEFIPRNISQHLATSAPEDNGWNESPSVPETTTDLGWTETPSGDNEWQAVPDYHQSNGGGYRGRGGGGREFTGRGRGGRGGGGFGGGFRGRQDYRGDGGGNYRGGNSRGFRGDGNRGGPRGRRGGGDRYRGGGDGNRGGRGGFGGGFNNRSAPQ